MKEINKKERINSAPSKALSVWIATAADLRPWTKAVAKNARETLDELHGHGVPLEPVLIELSRLKRRQLANERDAVEGVTANVRKVERLSVRKEREHLVKSLNVLNANPVVMDLLSVSPAALMRAATQIRSIRSKSRRGAPSRTDTRAMLLPLVEIFSRYGQKQPLWKQAGELLKYALGVSWSDPDRSAAHAMKAKRRPEAEQYYPPALDSIETKPARRAAAQILIAKAKEDAVDARVEKLRWTLDARPYAKKKIRIKKESNPNCQDIGCSAKKKDYAAAFGAGIGSRKGAWMESDKRGGWFFVCASCGRVRHSVCDGLRKTKVYNCRECVR